jgi:hypothetical protein
LGVVVRRIRLSTARWVISGYRRKHRTLEYYVSDKDGAEFEVCFVTVVDIRLM